MIEVCSFKSIHALTGAKRRLALKKNSNTTRPRKGAGQKISTPLSTRTVGIDLGDQTSHYCILDEQGDVISEGTVRTTEAGFQEQFRHMAHARIVLETGTHSPWVSRYLERLGHEVLVANARQVRIIYDNDRKTDKVDARTLARLARVDKSLLHPIRHRGAEAQAELAKTKYPRTELMRQIPGVGVVTSLAFALTIDDPNRFRRSRDVGSYLGLQPKQSDSGSSKPQLSISKAGDDLVRHLLVNCAHYVLGHWGPDCDLRRWGLSLMAHGGKNAKKRAVVAVARKLAVLMHTLWVSGEVYEPIRQSREAASTEAVPAA